LSDPVENPADVVARWISRPRRRKSNILATDGAPLGTRSHSETNESPLRMSRSDRSATDTQRVYQLCIGSESENFLARKTLASVLFSAALSSIESTSSFFSRAFSSLLLQPARSETSMPPDLLFQL
jgi:hypothetical protein